MTRSIVLIACLLAAPTASAVSTGSASDSLSDFKIAGAHIDQDYWAMRRMFPAMECQVSCTDKTIMYLDHPGTLWVSIGGAKINQLAFYFNVARDDGVRRDLILRDLTRLYGKPSKEGDCSVWGRDGGAIQLCPQGTGAVVHWNNENWQSIASVIPTTTPPVP